MIRRIVTPLATIAAVMLMLARMGGGQAGELARFTDAERQALRSAEARAKVSIEVDDPQVLSTFVESSKISLNVLGGSDQLRAWITVQVLIPGPIEETGLDRIAGVVRHAAGKWDSVGVRFVLPGQRVADRDPEMGEPWYAWRLFHGDKLDISTNNGLSPQAVEEQVRAIVPGEGEEIAGIWVDHNYSNGAVALLKGRKGARLVFLIDPTSYYEIKMPEAGGPRVNAQRKVGPDGSFKADGEETDRLAVKLDRSGSLLVYSVTLKYPWLIAAPWPSTRETVR
jgi:hypothetical protein